MGKAQGTAAVVDVFWAVLLEPQAAQLGRGRGSMSSKRLASAGCRDSSFPGQGNQENEQERPSSGAER